MSMRPPPKRSRRCDSALAIIVGVACCLAGGNLVAQDSAPGSEPTGWLQKLSNGWFTGKQPTKLERAAEAYRKAIAIEPDDGSAHCKLGALYFAQGKYDEAVTHLTRALAIDPKDAIAHGYLGITASKKGWDEAALKELETAIAFDPKNPDFQFNLAVVLATYRPPDKERARRHYQRALRLGATPDPLMESLLSSPLAPTSQALSFGARFAINALLLAPQIVARVQTGVETFSLKNLEKAIALNPNDPDAHFNLAVMLATSRPPDKEGARKHYQRALELGADPDTSLEAVLK